MTPRLFSTLLLLAVAEMDPLIRLLWGILIAIFVGFLVVVAIPPRVRAKNNDRGKRRKRTSSTASLLTPNSGDVRDAVEQLTSLPEHELASWFRDVFAMQPFLERRTAAAKALQDAGWSQAALLLEALIRDGDIDPRNYHMLGLCREKLGDGRNAGDAYSQGLVHHPGSAQLHAALGKFQFAQVGIAPISDALDLMRRSRASLSRAVALDGDNAQTLELLGAVQGALGEFGSAHDSMVTLEQLDKARAARLRAVIKKQQEARERATNQPGAIE